MKKIFLILVLASMFSRAYTIEIDEVNYFISGDHASVIAKNDGSSYSGDIIIPEEIELNSKTYKVSYIERTAFMNCSELLSIQLPNTITSIGSFEGCSKLKGIIIPDPVTTIGNRTFRGCSSLESIIIGSNIEEVSEEAFDYCYNLKSVYISDLESWCKIKFYKTTGSVAYGTLTYYMTSNPLQYGADLYLNGEKIVNLVIPETIPIISYFAFNGCSSFESVEISSNTKVYNGAFSNNKNLKTIHSYSYTMLSRCFSNCTSLTSVYLYHSYGMYDSFENCPNLETVMIPRGTIESDWDISRDDRYALFNLFPNAKEFIIPDGTERIGRGRFIHCSSIEKIKIPSTMKLIRNDAFWYCDNIKSVYVDDLQVWCNITFGENYYNNGNGTIYANPRNANPLHAGADLYVNGEKLVNCEIPNQVTKLNSGVFYGCNSIEKLIIGENVSKIEADAFYGNINLYKVIYPSTQIEFENEIFSGCKKLSSVGPLISNCSMEYAWETTIPSMAFYNITNLQTIIIPSTIKSIGDYAFFGKKAIENIYINAITPPSISSNTFYKYDATLFVPIDCKDAYSSAPYWKNFNIVELVDVESVNFDKDCYDIIVGESKTIDVTILPDKATYKDLYWSIDNNEIAQVENGIVLGLKTGVTKVTATTTDGTNLSASCNISVTNPVQSVSFSKSLIELEAGDSETITASCSPADADDISISWRSLNNDVATVANGNVLAIAVGETEVIASSVNGKEAHCKVIVNPTLATSITINKHELQLTTGKTDLLEASIFPAKTTSKKVKWETDNSQIASVDETGLVQAIANGTAIIKALTIDGSNIFDECVVTVTTLATDITLNTENANLIVGQSLPLTATLFPSETSNQDITWQSNNANCATVSAEGIVNALSTGVATITASTNDGTNLSASCIVTVTNPVISLTLDRTSADLMVGQQVTITASCIPSNADNTNIMWSSSDDSVASVNNGIVTANKLGSAVITARTANGLEAECLIIVIPTPVVSLSLNTASISIVRDETFRLICTVTPEDATNKELTWASLNDDIAKVDENGNVIGVSTGETTIIINAKSDPNISASCKVCVSTPVTALRFDCGTYELLIDDIIQLYAICTPADADNTMLAWATSNASVATVAGGIVTAKSEGTAIITAKTTDGSNLSASCQVNVSRYSQTITWNQDLANVVSGGELIKLEAFASSGLDVTFSSSDENIASIFAMGDGSYLNAYGEGEVDIVASQAGNDYYLPVSMTKTVNVEASSGISDISLDEQITVYTLNGFKVGTFSAEEYKKLKLAKGVYIVNGKKMVMK